MSDQQLRDEVMTLFMAGHETTANTLAWTWVLCRQHPDAEARLHAELDQVLGGPSADLSPTCRDSSTPRASSMRRYGFIRPCG